MPSIGASVHELRIKDAAAEWRIMYRIDTDAIVIAEMFQKKTRATPPAVIETCKRRLRRYDEAVQAPSRASRHQAAPRD
jgi:phage-related protein